MRGFSGSGIGSKRYSLTCLVTVLGVLVASRVAGESVNIVNHGFESPVLEDGRFTNDYVPGWTLSSNNNFQMGVWNPNETDLAGGNAFEGLNVAYHNSGSMSQTLLETLRANTHYTLTVQQNYSAHDTSTAGTWQVELLAAGSPLVSHSGTVISLERDTFVLRTLQHTTGDPVTPGQELAIRFTLFGPGYVTDVVWDDVQLDATAAAEPLLGDLDCDGDVDFDDISAFVLGLNEPERYESTFGLSPAVKGDADGDGDLDFDDIPGFVDLLSVSSTHPVFEPGTLILGFVSLLCLSGRRPHRMAWWCKSCFAGERIFAGCLCLSSRFTTPFRQRSAPRSRLRRIQVRPSDCGDRRRPRGGNY